MDYSQSLKLIAQTDDSMILTVFCFGLAAVNFFNSI